MRRLLLIRHAKAEAAAPGRDDYRRALTDRGRDDARRVAGLLRARDLIPDVLLHSGASRTKQTAEILASAWPRPVELEEEPGLYDATADALLARVRALADLRASVAIVGHNPGIGEFAATLAGSGAFADLRRMASKFPTSAVAALDFPIDTWREVERRGALLVFHGPTGELGSGAD